MLILLTVSLLAFVDGVSGIIYYYRKYVQTKRMLDREYFHALHYDADEQYALLLSFIVQNKNELCAQSSLLSVARLEKKAYDMNLPVCPDPFWVQDQFLENVVLWSRKKSPRDRGFVKSLHRHILVSTKSETGTDETFALMLRKYFKREHYFMQKVSHYRGRTARIFYNLSAHRAYEIISLIKIRSLKNEFLPIFITALPPATGGVLFAW